VVGVVGDIATGRSGSRDGLMVYLPFAQTPDTRASLLLRSSGRLPFEMARAAAAALDPDLPVVAAMSLSDHAGAALFPQRLAAALSGAFGLFGLLLAAVGLYGLATYLVSERRHELAIRAALGARAKDLRRLILLQGLRPVAFGVALGLAGALIFGRLAAAFVPAVGAFDGAAFAGGALLLIVVASLATGLPARRAAVARPAEVLRSE
jgi:putative ABC transport system permease protein